MACGTTNRRRDIYFCRILFYKCRPGISHSHGCGTVGWYDTNIFLVLVLGKSSVETRKIVAFSLFVPCSLKVGNDYIQPYNLFVSILTIDQGDRLTVKRPTNVLRALASPQKLNRRY